MNQPSGAPALSHLDAEGTARMVDVGAKQESQREAVAAGEVRMAPETLRLLRAGNVPKGDVLGTARVAGILAAKRTAELIPLCHPLPLTYIGVDFSFDEETSRVLITATARCQGQTGVEMDALTAVSVAALTIYDMAKALEKTMVIGEIRLLRKTGGRSGGWERPEIGDRRSGEAEKRRAESGEAESGERRSGEAEKRRSGKRKNSLLPRNPISDL